MIYQNEYATRTLFVIPLISVITGFISIALFLIHIYNTASILFGDYQYYRMLRKMTELLYAREWFYLYPLNMPFPLPSPREKYLRKSVTMTNVYQPDFQIKKPWFVEFALICAVNPPTATDFNLPPYCHRTWAANGGSQLMRFGPLTRVRSSTALHMLKFLDVNFNQQTYVGCLLFWKDLGNKVHKKCTCGFYY